MQNKPVALVTGQSGDRLQVAKDLAAKNFTVLVGSRNLERGDRRHVSSEGHWLRRHYGLCDDRAYGALTTTASMKYPSARG